MSSQSPSSELVDATKNLSSKDPKMRLDGMRQIITLFTHGENCSSAQPQIASLPQDENVSMHRFANILSQEYARSDVNTEAIVKNIVADFQKPNPVIKVLAVKQAGFLTTDQTAEYLIPLIIEGAESPDPYVRKTAALAILKVVQKRYGFLETYHLGSILLKLLDDANPNVAANAISAIVEINSSQSVPSVIPPADIVAKLLTSIEDAHEWAQIQILEFVSDYIPLSSDEAKRIISRLSTRLVQANSGVTMAAIRCCLKMNSVITDQQFATDVIKKVILTLIAILNNSKEVQFVGLRSISVLLQKYRGQFSSYVNLFFCKSDDPIYIKLEKLDIILTLTNERNVKQVLDELNSYTCSGSDHEFVRKSVRAIGRIACVFEETAKTCIDSIISLIQSKVRYVIQECIVVSVSVIRKYHNKCEQLIKTIFQYLSETLDDHRAKTAIVWLLGEYPSIVTNAAEVIETIFLEYFMEETTDVQLAILTTVVKFFLANPEEGQGMLKKVLSLAINEVENPDLNDRAYTYLRLLSDCANYAEEVILGNSGAPPSVNVDLQILEPRLVDVLVPVIGTLAVIYGKFPQEFVPVSRNKQLQQSPQSPKGDGRRTSMGPSPARMITYETVPEDLGIAERDIQLSSSDYAEEECEEEQYSQNG